MLERTDDRAQNKPALYRLIKTPVLTSLPSVSKTSKSRVMRYCVGATSCQMQFLLGGYSLGHPGLVIEPFSLVMKPPQAAGHNTTWEEAQTNCKTQKQLRRRKKKKHFNLSPEIYFQHFERRKPPKLYDLPIKIIAAFCQLHDAQC